jgi:two-component system, cell cycle sensor histidine kinase and response regulator CckA
VEGGRRDSRIVLVVEDSETVRRVVCGMLAGAGYQVLDAVNGVAALRLLRGSGKPVDVVLTDVIMPEMGGEELHREIAKSWPELPVLFMTGYTENAFVRSVDSAASRILREPFTPAELLRAVDSVAA